MFALSHFAWVWEPTSTTEVSIATKADDARVNTDLWAVRGIDPKLEAARKTIRVNFLLRQWRRNILRECLRFLAQSKQSSRQMDYARDLIAVREAVVRAANASWWEWHDGSRLFFWRWPPSWRKEARDRARAYHLIEPPPKPHARVVEAESDQQSLMDDKLEKLMKRRYIVLA